MYTGPETFCPGAKQIDNVRPRHGQLVLVLSTLARGFPFIQRRGEKIEKCHSHSLATSSEITILSRSDLGQMGFISHPRVRGKIHFFSAPSSEPDILFHCSGFKVRSGLRRANRWSSPREDIWWRIQKRKDFFVHRMHLHTYVLMYYVCIHDLCAEIIKHAVFVFSPPSATATV